MLVENCKSLSIKYIQGNSLHQFHFLELLSFEINILSRVLEYHFDSDIIKRWENVTFTIIIANHTYNIKQKTITL